MIQIKRDNLHVLARRHYEEYFKKKGFLEKLEQIVEVEENLTCRNFFTVIRNQIENIIMGNPNYLSEITININKNFRSVMGKIHNHNSLKKKLKHYEQQKKLLKKEFEILREKEESETQIAFVKEKVEKVTCIIKLVNRHIQEGKSLIDKLEKVFDYDHFCRQYSKGNKKKWGAYELVKQLKVEVCPYCNRQFITVSEPNEEEKGRTRPQLDHFYSQSRFPFLAVSFFNLIPCCHVCNSNLKGNHEFSINTHIHPYEKGFGDLVQFTLQFKEGNGQLDYLKAWYSNPDIFSIGFKVNEIEKRKYDDAEIELLLKRIDNNKKTFKLNSLYNSHTDYVGEILLKSLRYNDAKIDSLCHEFPNLFPSKHDVVRVVYSNYVDPAQLDKRVLSKLTRDITQEFGIKYT
ncbi:hypothetical protein [Bacillus toyonensis]|uniref:hypothetical protein n=1 Tax=Bacillus toyonensis TaxID=155322 RepID=UPI000BED5078|nr:hypothetical protein [Bacillus toyonensis]PEC62934.1 hypothetical protein CON62_28665 [Bacillus toyonensis]